MSATGPRFTPSRFTPSRSAPSRSAPSRATRAASARSSANIARGVALAREAARPQTPFAAASTAVPLLLPVADGHTEIAAAGLRRPVTGGVDGLPQPLAPSDAARLVRIFDLQARGESVAAAQEADRLDDRRLMSHVLADRWLRTPQSAPAAAVLAWLAEFPDHPDAGALYALLRRRMPHGAPPAPEAVPDLLAMAAAIAPEDQAPDAPPIARNAALERVVRAKARDGDVSGALLAIAGARGLAPGAAALLQGDVALILFQSGRDQDALTMAQGAARGAEGHGGPAFVAGLAAFAAGQPEAAIPYFEITARAELAPPSLRAAGAYWTARASVRARRPGQHIAWLLQAAQEPRTFYGLLARRALGLAPGFAWEGEVAGEAETNALAETAGGWRALSLLQIGQRDRAEAELRRLWAIGAGNPALGRAMLVVASTANMPALASQLAQVVQGSDGRPRDFARFPVPRLEPLGGFRVDPSLIYALARQESNFDPGAVSGAGARGLMQVMPATAAYILGDPSLRGRSGHQRLHDPAFSLEVGQRYLHHLNSLDSVDGDLIRMLAAYNAGPGNVARWMPPGRHQNDPLLFIESIPAGETRAFVQRVLAYSWIYASRLGLPSPSLDQLAAGQFPRFAGPADVERMLMRQQRLAMH
ncbi:transglycosylase SLT domain-containing protein [Humitalea rosea]|uniref:transglycosylase SLT domain-containing protein n=1 Tax=Humitalea rosea TaxID=990373 RepID=UPI0024829B19|nr:transglycosylase SLT domain-containing protein [Humitalea rosea]